MNYVDSFVTPVPRKKLPQYLRIEAAAGSSGRAESTSNAWRTTSRPASTLFKAWLKKGEVVFSYATLRSRKARGRVIAKVMSDKRLGVHGRKKLPFDGKRMFWGGCANRPALASGQPARGIHHAPALARVGMGPWSAAMFSRMCSTLDVAGMAQVTAGCETTNFRKNCDQAVQPISGAQSGSGLPSTSSNSLPVRNGRLISAALPRAAAAGSNRSSASRCWML